MKKTFLTIISLTSLFLSGCVCTEYVNNMGKTTPAFEIKQAWCDASGNIVYAGILYRRSLNNFESKNAIGNRFLILNAPAVRDKIITEVITRGTNDTTIKLHAVINIQPSKTPEEYQSFKQWYLYPPDIINHIENAKLPAYLSSSIASKLPYNNVNFALPYTIDYTTYQLIVRYNFANKDKIHLTNWGYSSKILLVPAVLLDIFTSPAQFVIELDKMMHSH